MPELPEVETTKNAIAPYIENAHIEQIVVRQPKLRWQVSPELSQISNQKVIAVSRRAKYLIFHLDQGFIIGHLGMSGTLRIVDRASPLDKHDHLDIMILEGKVLRYNDPRRFGAWLWATNLETFPLFKKLGPEPLESDFNASYLYQKSRQKQTALKQFIMNNAVVVGVGNIYANESLFLAGLHPLKTPHSLTKKQCDKLVAAIKQVLTQAIKQGGTTLKDFLAPDGRPGYFAQELLVYGRKDLACVNCGYPIESLVIGQRNSFCCPLCQQK